MWDIYLTCIYSSSSVIFHYLPVVYLTARYTDRAACGMMVFIGSVGVLNATLDTRVLFDMCLIRSPCHRTQQVSKSVIYLETSN
jgi:hypothetical protein